ncbi:MAG TPA: carboxypeptidase-like regulatory domain-containing protein [Anaerolineales bacterium]|nr:carboxypeptidase-like regulatory domain-containing protein [Anaerolineales bacterium]
MTVFTVAFLFFSAVHYILKGGDIAHCAWYGSARAWIDSNADGRINSDESPLSDVQVYVEDLQNHFIDISWPAITDQDGDVQLSISLPGCSKTAFEIYAEVPEGYRATTKPRIAVDLNLEEGLNIEHVYYFGFVPRDD